MGAHNERNLLLLNVRRQVLPVRCLRREMKRRGWHKLSACDRDYNDPIRFEVDDFFLFQPPRTQLDVYKFADELARKDIGYVVPWIDSEIFLLSEHQYILDERAIVVLVPPWKYASIMCDKTLTAQWAARFGMAVPKLYTLTSPLFPLVAKPRRGQGSVGVHRMDS